MPRSRYRFDAEYFVVVTPFEWEGHQFAEGETFPWKELGLVEYQRRLLWVSNKVDVVDEPTVGGPEQSLPASAPVTKPSKPPRSSARS